MGTVVQFERPRRAAIERVLERASAMYRQRLQAQEDLPRVLALAAAAGLDDLVVRAIRSWGEGAQAPEAVLEMVRTEAVVAGVRAGLV